MVNERCHLTLTLMLKINSCFLCEKCKKNCTKFSIFRLEQVMRKLNEVIQYRYQDKVNLSKNYIWISMNVNRNFKCYKKVFVSKLNSFLMV